MKIAISLAHCSSFPYRSGYELRSEELTPVEYVHSKAIASLLVPMMREDGHTARVFSKLIEGEVTRRKYDAALVECVRDIESWAPDLAVEMHCDYSSREASGCKALVGDSPNAAAWATSWLRHYSRMSGIKQRGVWGGERRIEGYGRNYFLDCGTAASVILECGYASHWGDRQILNNDKSTRAAANAARPATEKLWTISKDISRCS